MRPGQDQRPSGCTPLGCLLIVLSWVVIFGLVGGWFDLMEWLGFLQAR